MARRQFGQAPKSYTSGHIHARQFPAHAAAIGMEAEAVAKHAQSSKRQPVGIGWIRLRQTAPLHPTLRRKLDQIAKSARRLLKNLGVLCVNSARRLTVPAIPNFRRHDFDGPSRMRRLSCERRNALPLWRRSY